MDELSDALLSEITRRIVAVSDLQQVILFGSRAGRCGSGQRSGHIGGQRRGGIAGR